MATKARQQYHADETTLSKERREFSISDDVQEKIDWIEEGAQVNTIETIRVNWNEVQPDENKAIDLTIPWVIDSLSSTSITDALSARQWKILYDKIDNISRIWHFLALWDASTWLPVTDPEVSPYEYHAGDFYTISVVASQWGTNYKPSWTEYISWQASTAVETDDVEVNDFYFYDGQAWRHMKNSWAGDVVVDGSLSTTSRNPVENRVITNALSWKQNTLTAWANIQINWNTISATDTKYTAGTWISIANWVISNTQTSAERWNITGTLSDQTDLQTVLTSKATDANVVHKSWAETIAWTKTFSTSPVVPSKTTTATNTGTAIATEAQVYKKQDTLVSGTNIKTINSNSLLGSWNITLNDVKSSATAPSNPTEWMLWYDTTNDVLKAYNGTQWNAVDTNTTYNAWEGIEIWTYNDYSVMRWPCPKWFHIPMESERQTIKTMRTDLWTSMEFVTAFKIPKAWRLYNTSWGFNNYSAAFFRSCKASWDNYQARQFWASTGTPTISSTARSYWYSIRPFKDIPVVPDSNRDTIYAWTWDAGIFHNPTLWLISVSSDWTNWVTIADKNLWATTVYTGGGYSNESNCWWFFQWGNNYMFPRSWATNTSATQVNATWYWPWNYYNSSTFITSDWAWDTSNNKNLRWWLTWVVTLNNAISNTWVLSVNGQTWDVTIDTSEASSITTTQPSNPVEWDVYYDTANDQLKVYDWTNWNVVWDDAADINTKTFYISSTSDLANAQAAYDWYVAGKNPIVVYWTEKPIYIVYDTSDWLRFRSSDDKKSWTKTSTMVNYWRMLNLVVSNWTVTSISTWDYTGNAINVLSTGINYSTPYTPQYDWSPATKKYVDDSVVEYNAWEWIEIWTVQDYSAMRWPCPEGFHVPSQNEWVALCWILTTTFGLSNNMTTLNTYLKMPNHWYRSESNSNVVNTTYCYYWSSTRNADYAAGSVYATSNAINLWRFNARARWFNVRWFRDKPIIPDGSWVTLYDWSSVSEWAGIFHNITLWLISVSWDGINWTTIADKNIWASTVYNNWDTVTDSNCGGYFQWGNNYMFPFSWSVTTSSTQVDATGYWPWNYYSSDIFITPSDSPKRRENPENTNLRWWVTWVVTLNNAISNTGVLSVNGQTWDVTISTPEESNTKTFYLSGTSDLTNAQAAYDWYLAGKNPIIVLDNMAYLVYSQNSLSWLRFVSSMHNSTNGTKSFINREYVNFTISDGSVTKITKSNINIEQVAKVLETDVDYPTPYTPQYNGSPATKKYVDDSVIEYNAGEGIEIWTVQDYSAMRWPCPEGFHVPQISEWKDLKTIFNSLWLSSWENFREYFKIPAASQNYKDNNWNTVNAGSATLLTCTESTSDVTKACSIQVYSSIGTSATFYKSYAINIRPFKDDAVIPDSSWATLYQWAWDAWIFYNSTLWIISISSDWTNWKTIADKNLWATEVYNYWDTITASKRWYLFQWWNDNWFWRTETLTKSSNQIDTTWYWPNNHYSSSTFITWNNDWSNPSNANLRWWVTWVVTLDNAITNTGVLSVNGQTGDVTLKTINNNALVGSGNISLNVIFSWAITPAASSQYEGKIFYNTADKVFYTCDGTQWSKIWGWWFELAPNSPLSPKYRWYWTQAQYDALTQYYTDEVGDTVYYTI